jgi:hypothetical protein
VRLPKPGDDLLDQFVPHLIRRALKEGDRTAVRLCVERVRPTRRGVALSFRLPAIPSAEDAERAVEKVTEALHRGQCTPAGATEVMKLLQARAQLLRDMQMESRLSLNLRRAVREKTAGFDGPRSIDRGFRG